MQEVAKVHIVKKQKHVNVHPAYGWRLFSIEASETSLLLLFDELKELLDETA